MRAIEFVQPKVVQFNGRRWSVADSFHRSKVDHKVLLNARVERVILEEVEKSSTLRATGVSYSKDGIAYDAVASKAVILSAGTVGSPVILLRSGVGPRHIYEQFDEGNRSSTNPKHKVDLPAVGSYLQDHVTTGLDLIVLNATLGFEPWQIYSPRQLFDYVRSGKGSLTTPGCEALAFIRTHLSSNDSIPDLGFMVIPLGVTHDSGAHLKRIFNINDKSWQNYFKPLIGSRTISILPIVLRPKSFGSITIKRTENGAIGTIIDPRYLSHPQDVDVLVAGLKIINFLVGTSPFRDLGASMNRRQFPGCEHEEFATDAYWRCYVRHLTLTAYHPVGTCRMGAHRNDSVTNPDTLQVHNVNNLFVCDASVMPNIPSANPQAAVGMLAMKFVHSFHRNIAANR